MEVVVLGPKHVVGVSRVLLYFAVNSGIKFETLCQIHTPCQISCVSMRSAALCSRYFPELSELELVDNAG